MTLFYRRILYVSFILFFVVLTTAISFYAAGYEMNFEQGSVRRTGALIVETDPKGAHIRLGAKRAYNWFYGMFYDGENIQTPRKLRNILPDEYDLTLSKDGYFDYERKVTVSPGQTTVLNDIILFKRSQPENVTPNPFTSAQFTDNTAMLAVLGTSTLHTIRTSNGDARTFTLDYEALRTVIAHPAGPQLQWAPSNKKVLIGEQPFAVVNTENGRVEAHSFSPLFAEHTIRAITWDDFSDNRMYFLSGDGIYAFDIMQQRTRLIATAADIISFAAYEGELAVLRRQDGVTMLTVYAIESGAAVVSLATPVSDHAAFIGQQGSHLLVRDAGHRIVYVIDPHSLLPIQETIPNVDEVSVVNNDTLLYWNAFEIWVYHAQSQSKQLIARWSDSISDAAWYDYSDRHIFFSTDKGIYSIELEGGAYFSVLQLTPMGGVRQFAVDSSGESLYAVTDGDAHSVVKIELR